MKTMRTKFLCFFLAVITVMSLISTSVMAATCTHSYTKKYSYENGNMHSYVSVCNKCGTETTGYGYSGWEDHTFNTSGKCTKCGYSKVCSHTNTTKKYNNLSSTQHEYYTHCNGCGIDYYFTTANHSYSYGSWTKYSSTQHKRTGTCACGATKTEYQNHTLSNGTCTVCGYVGTTTCSHASTSKTYSGYSDTQHKTVTKCNSCSKQISSAYESHTFSGNSCTKCGYTKTAVAASVSLSASSSAGTLGSAGGEISAEGAPASYTVKASATGCSVTKIVYTQNGKTYTVNGSSVTITASTESAFTTTTFTAYTSVSGVTATFTVNHKVVRHNTAQVMWETSNTAVIRSITGNGMNKSLSYTMTIPNSYDGQSNLSSSQVNTIQSLIGVSDGKTYTVNYTRTITVYTPAAYSSTGSRVDLGTFDGNNSSEIESCLTRWGWSTTTAAAIRQAASSSLTFTTGLATNCTAKWINTENNQQLYSKTFGSGTVSSSSSKTVSVSYTDYSGSGNYVFEKLTYSGDSSGTSTTQSFSATYTVKSKPLTVTFYCHPTSSSTVSEVTKGDITVYVRDRDTNELLSGAAVSGAGKTGTTNTSGGVIFRDLAFKSYTFTASKTGYVSNTGTATISASSPTKTITIYLSKVAGSEPEKEDDPTGQITIYVRDAETNATISNASVYGCGSTKYTSSSGYVNYSNLSPGTYSFTASKSGYVTNSASVTLTSSSTSKTATIYLSPEEDDDPVTPTTGDITVYVRDAVTNNIIVSAAVTGCGTTKYTTSYGRTTYSDISLGTYSFTASYSGYESGSTTVTLTSSSTSKTATIYLSPEKEDEPIAPTTGNITVYVRDKSTNEVLSDASVTCNGKIQNTTSVGCTIFGSVPFGTYTVSAGKNGYTGSSTTVSISAQKSDETVTIYLTKESTAVTGSLKVYVYDDETRAVISGASVTENGVTKSTNTSGYVTFNSLPLGTHTLLASKSGYSSATKTAVMTTSGTTTVKIYLKKALTTGSVKVNVVDRDTKTPIRNATVSLGSATSSAPAGDVTFTSVPFNTYTVVADASGYDSASTTVTISSSEPDKEVTIYLKKLPTTGSVKVHVLDKDTKSPIRNATVSLGSTMSSAPTGDVTFTDVPFNTYTVTASANGYDSAGTSVTISSTEPDKDVTIYLKIKSDVSITANDVNGTVYRGSTIMVAATVHTDSSLDFTPTNPLTVTMKATKNGSTVFDTQIASVICPKNESNLVWFAVKIPESGYTNNAVTFSFEVTLPTGTADSNSANNKSMKSATPVVLPARSTPKTSLELNAPSDYNGSSYKAQTSPSRSWSVWEWNGSSFTKKNYSAKLTTTVTLSPDSSAVWKKQNATSKLWTTRSGYGLITSVSVSCTGLKSGMLAGNAKVNAYYPEFNYSTAEERSNMLLRTSENAAGYTASYTFAEDPNNLNNAKMHKSPVWFPDGEYSVKYEVYDLWTPAGMLTGTTHAIVNIEGSIYDDYYTNRS